MHLFSRSFAALFFTKALGLAIFLIMKILCLIWLTPQLAWGFMNIESLRSKPKEGWKAGGKIQFNQQQGNTDKILGSAATLNSYQRGDHEFILIGKMRYGESFQQKDTEDGALHLRYTRHLIRSHFAEIYTQFQYNKFKALNSRDIAGIGYRYKREVLSFGVGAFSEYEVIEGRPNESGIRANTYLSFNKKNQTGFEFSTIIYLQPSLSRSEDLRSILNMGISQKVIENINLMIQYQNVYDQQPPTDIKTFDSSFLFGISFT